MGPSTSPWDSCWACFWVQGSSHIEADPMVSFRQSRPVNVQTRTKQCLQTDMLHVTLKWTHLHLRPILFGSYLLAAASLLSLLSLPPENWITLFFVVLSKIEILQADLHVHPHTCVQKMHTHTHTHRSPCGHAFFCFPVSTNKKALKRSLSKRGKGLSR